MNSGFGRFLIVMALLAAVISFINIQKLNKVQKKAKIEAAATPDNVMATPAEDATPDASMSSAEEVAAEVDAGEGVPGYGVADGSGYCAACEGGGQVRPGGVG